MVPQDNLSEDSLLDKFEVHRRADFGHRLGAWLIDFIIIFAGQFVLFASIRSLRQHHILMQLMITALPAFAYLAPMTALAGQTLGKMILRIRVVDKGGYAPGWGRAILRETVGKFISGVLLLGYLWVLWDAKKQGWHDKIAGTTVIRGAPLLRQRKAALIGAGVWVTLVFACVACIAFISPGTRSYGLILRNPPLRLSTGDPLESASNAQGAISREKLDQAIKDGQTKPNNAKAKNDAAIAQLLNSNRDQAEKDLEESLELDPDNSTIAGNLGRVYYDSGKYDKAISVLQKVYRVTQYAELGLLLANIFIKKGDYNSAEEIIRGVPDNQSTRFDLNTVLGAIHIGRDLIDLAIEDLQRANASDPNNATGLYNLGVAYQGMNDLAKADQHYRSAIDKDPNLAEAYNNLGTILARLGKWDESFEAFHKAEELKPDCDLCKENLAITVHESNQHVDAIVGVWVFDSGFTSVSGAIQGQRVAQSLQLPGGGQITISKVSQDTYRISVALPDGTAISTTVSHQNDGSYRGQAATLPGMPLPPGVSISGTITFWMRGDVLFGDTRGSISGNGVLLQEATTWKVRRGG